MTAYLQCISENCREKFPITSKIYHCQHCGDLLDANYDFTGLDDPHSLKELFFALVVLL
ncbi:MAG: hypothetical protein IPK14_22225 [Blastocatellia bacterium]|nr:hypothetical protein [Blastocatellia bacterium]